MLETTESEEVQGFPFAFVTWGALFLVLFILYKTGVACRWLMVTCQEGTPGFVNGSDAQDATAYSDKSTVKSAEVSASASTSSREASQYLYNLSKPLDDNQDSVSLRSARSEGSTATPLTERGSASASTVFKIPLVRASGTEDESKARADSEYMLAPMRIADKQERRLIERQDSMKLKKRTSETSRMASGPTYSPKQD